MKLIHQLSRLCPNPQKALSLSKGVVELNMKLAKRTLRKDLLKNLQKRSLGTKDAEQVEIKLRRENTNGKRDAEIIKHIMNKKIKDAEKDENIIRREFKNTKKLVNNEVKYISEEGRILRRIQKQLVNNVWYVGKESNIKYISDIERKYGNKKVKVTEYNGVKVGDKLLNEEIKTKAIIYGNVKVSDDAKEVLKLPPKFATFKEIKIQDIETEVEKGMAKYRMHIRNEGESEPDEHCESAVLNKDKSNTVDLTNLKVTDLPFCKRIYIPNPLETKLEVKIQCLKDKFVDKAKEYIREKTENGKVKESNKK